jgi:ATP-dependent Lhr-like helicase
MRDLAARSIRLVEVETPTASPFARSLLFRYVGAFMYEGDAPLAERRAQALALDSALLADLLGQANMRELLDPLVVEEVERELQRLAPGRASRDAEAVADLLRALGPLTTEEVAARAADPAAAPEWLAGLAAQRRVLEIRVGGQPRWAAVEDAGRLRDALGAALPPGVPGAFTEPAADPLRDLILRYGRTHGPFTALEVAQRYGLGVAVVSGTLQRLAAAGSVSEGEFRAAGRGTEWCESGVLRLVRRRCLAKLRKEVEPVPPQAFAAFLPSWQRAGRLDRVARRAGGAGPDAVYEAVEQLAGVAVPASALETLVLPGRVPGYSPALLDELTAAGDVAWAGAGGLPGGDGWLVLAPAETAPLLLPEPGEITMTPVHEALLELLGGGGALFFRALSDQVTAALGGAGAGDQAVASAIWDLVWAGRVTNDTLAPLRTVLSSGRPVTPVDAPAPAPPGLAGSGLAGPGLAASGLVPVSGRSGPAVPGGGGRLQLSGGRRGRVAGRRPGYGRAALPSRSGPPTVSGRWSLLAPPDADPTRQRHALAISLLERYGIVLRGAVAAERVPGGFSAIYPVLRAMEDGGQCRRGYFVEGLGAAQFALPGAVDRMRALAETLAAEQAPAAAAEPEWNVRPPLDHAPEWVARLPAIPAAKPPAETQTPVLVLAAADPANAYGAALPWPERPQETAGGHRPGRKAGALVVLTRGDLVLYVERGGKTLLSWSSDPDVLEPAARALAAAGRAGALGRLTVERADGGAVYDSPLARALESAGFRPTPRGLRLRG